MNSRSLAIFGVVVFFVSGVTARTEEVKVEPGQPYLVLEVTKLSTFEEELNSAGSQRFQLMMSTTSDNGAKVQALMQRGAFGCLSLPPGCDVLDRDRRQGNERLCQRGISSRSAHVDGQEGPDGGPHRNISQGIEERSGPGMEFIDMTYGQVVLERQKAQ
jgi:hypothetical protein